MVDTTRQVAMNEEELAVMIDRHLIGTGGFSAHRSPFTAYTCGLQR
jgi:hypothetical protein